MLARLIKMAEYGYLPDSLIRLGIRRLCKVRVGWAKSVGPDDAPEGTYYYILYLNDPDYTEPLTGYLYLTR